MFATKKKARHRRRLKERQPGRRLFSRRVTALSAALGMMLGVTPAMIASAGVGEFDHMVTNSLQSVPDGDPAWARTTFDRTTGFMDWSELLGEENLWSVELNDQGTFEAPDGLEGDVWFYDAFTVKGVLDEDELALLDGKEFDLSGFETKADVPAEFSLENWVLQFFEPGATVVDTIDWNWRRFSACGFNFQEPDDGTVSAEAFTDWCTPDPVVNGPLSWDGRFDIDVAFWLERDRDFEITVEFEGYPNVTYPLGWREFDGFDPLEPVHGTITIKDTEGDIVVFREFTVDRYPIDKPVAPSSTDQVCEDGNVTEGTLTIPEGQTFLWGSHDQVEFSTGYKIDGEFVESGTRAYQPGTYKIDVVVLEAEHLRFPAGSTTTWTENIDSAECETDPDPGDGDSTKEERKEQKAEEKEAKKEQKAEEKEAKKEAKTNEVEATEQESSDDIGDESEANDLDEESEEFDSDD